VAGALASGAAVAAVDAVDHDDTVTGIDAGADADLDEELDEEDADALITDGAGYGTGKHIDRPDLYPGNDVPGVQTGGRAADGTPDTRGVMEKTADAVTGDRIDDKTGKHV
jgi:hypothetical protein